MPYCSQCGSQLAEGVAFCSACGAKVESPPLKPSVEGEAVLGTILFGGYYKDICFTDRRVIQFEVMRDRYKFLVKALGPKPLSVDKGTKVSDVLPFLKQEIPRSQIASIEVRNHGRFGRGRIEVRTTMGGEVELARIDVDVDKASFSELVGFVNGIYPEIKKIIS
ncbi:MAG TPA: zinc ribbon domain-containing protein [Nitrososphaerales archaeon]|nr:zinc ribbon domain-containing protein [Nitrososphaerales archaeon]